MVMSMKIIRKMDLSEQNGFESLYFMNITMSEQDLKTAAAKDCLQNENAGYF